MSKPLAVPEYLARLMDYAGDTKLINSMNSIIQQFAKMSREVNRYKELYEQEKAKKGSIEQVEKLKIKVENQTHEIVLLRSIIRNPSKLNNMCYKKKAFPTLATAEKTAGKNEMAKVYKCPACELWHITTK